VTRCFVALWPDATTCARLDALARAQARACPGAQRTAPENLHLTLAFLGDLDLAQAPRIAAMLAAIAVPGGAWILDRVDGFAGPRVVWAGGPDDDRLEALVRSVRAGLDALQIPFDPRPFVPHVTLLRKAVLAHAVPLAQPLSWPFTRPVLVVSERDPRGRTRYRALH
jgi:2'-5' RNA ligase